MQRKLGWLVSLLALLLTGCGSSGSLVSIPGGTPQPLPHFDHIVVVMEENHSAREIIGASNAPYINGLAQRGVQFTDAHAVAHPSEPNYLAIFAGSTFGLSSDNCPQNENAPNLGGELLGQHLSFVGYSESMPSAGFTDCGSGGSGFTPDYVRKHNPWVDFADIPASSNQPFTSFPSDFAQLPTVAFVIPNEQNDMHSGSVDAGDSWLHTNIDPYAQWASAHNSLLIVAWDEDDGSTSNQVPLIFVGAHLRAGKYTETVTHYDVLRTIEALTGVAFTGSAAQATTIADVWR